MVVNALQFKNTTPVVCAGIVGTSSRSTHPQRWTVGLHQGRTIFRLPSAPHGRMDTAIAQRPTQRFWTLRVPNRHATNQKLFRSSSSSG